LGEDAIRCAVERQFPELTGGYHLPRFAQVTAVADAPADAGFCDDFRQRYGGASLFSARTTSRILPSRR